jgi:hypothetical protein
LSMDFITHLPGSFGHTVIWVICDRLSKYVHFLGLPTHFTAQDLATRFSAEIFRLHGIPKTIVSDRDPLFLSKFWKDLFCLQGTTLKYSTAYHPETDGQTEVVNRTLETYLRCFASDHPKTWFKFLHLAEYWHNTTVHSAIKMTPFEALYGRTPPSIPDYVHNTTTIPDLQAALEHRQLVLATLKENLVKSRWKMEAQANKHRRDVTFQQGDLVLLRLQPYRQQTVSTRTSQKLSKRYFGPFKVLRHIGTLAYELDLPPSSKIHPVFHVSQLREYKGNDPENHFVPIPPALSTPSTSPMDRHKTEDKDSTETVANKYPGREQDTRTPSLASKQLQGTSKDKVASGTLVSNLEDKVKSEPDSSDRKAEPVEPPKIKRTVQKPKWSKDFIFKY